MRRVVMKSAAGALQQCRIHTSVQTGRRGHVSSGTSEASSEVKLALRANDNHRFTRQLNEISEASKQRREKRSSDRAFPPRTRSAHLSRPSEKLFIVATNGINNRLNPKLNRVSHFRRSPGHMDTSYFATFTQNDDGIWILRLNVLSNAIIQVGFV